MTRLRCEVSRRIGGHIKPKYVVRTWVEMSDGSVFQNRCIEVLFHDGLGGKMQANLYAKELMRTMFERHGGTLVEDNK